MCGIFGYAGKRDCAAHIVLSGLKDLEYRGYDSWGIAVLKQVDTQRNIIVKKQIGKIGEATVEDLPTAHIAFGHTRWATHGSVTQINAHPHLDCTGTIALIHNGIIENYLTLKNLLKSRGHRFISDTDTETAVHLIEEYARKLSPCSKAFQKAFNQITGLNAFIVLSAKDERLIAIRNGSPLVVGYGNDENFLASDATALLPYTRQVHYLTDNQMAIVSRAGIMLFDVKTGDEVKPDKQRLTWTVEQANKGTYPFFMLKEIHEQPAVIADIASSYLSQAEKLSNAIKTSYGTYMVGCGTAAYACMAGAYLFSKIARRHVNWAVGSEFSYQLDFLTPKSMVIALSQSGETMDTLESVRRSKEKGAKIFALVNVPGSSLYRESDEKILLGAGPEKGVASTKAFIAKLAHLILTAYVLTDNGKQGQRILMGAARESKRVLSDKSLKHIEKLAQKINRVHHMYVIGRGLSYPASLETALKIKEVSYIHAEGLAAGELKHGPLALVEKGTPCITFLPNDETYGATLAGAMEMKARGGYIIGISYQPHEIFDYYIPVKDVGEATIIPNVIVGQLLGYYLAIALNLDPDKPRNLAKSVTVK